MGSINRLRLGYRLGILLTVFMVGLSVLGASAYYVLEKLEINGPVYRRIVLGKDLVADILPPPEYIIESYQVSLEMASGLGVSPAAGIERLKTLETEYRERHAFWARQELDGKLADALLSASYAPAQTFYSLALQDFGPALLADDQGRAAAALKKMKAAYEAHRTAIDNAVRIANQINLAEEAGARNEIRTNNTVLFMIFMATCIVSVAVATGIVKGLLRELGGEPHDAARIARGIASGDLTMPIPLREGDSSSLLHAMKSMQQMLAQTVAVIQTSVAAVRNGSEEIAAGTMDLSSRTEHHVSTLEETAATLENLSNTVQQTAASAQEASQRALRASDVANNGSKAIMRVVSIMDSINASSGRIAEITSEIDGIAFQTNILSLNAAVEAARAGEQGAGFAVVASEVRNLAQRSSAASRRIKSLIEDAAREAAAGQDTVAEAGGTIQRILESVHEVAGIITGISKAASEQSISLSEINAAVSRMGHANQQNAALVEEAAAASGALHEQADHLLAQANRFTVAPQAISMPQNDLPASSAKSAAQQFKSLSY